MQNLTSTLGRLAAIMSCAVALGACSRAEYATLPKSPAYLGSKSVAIAPRPATPAPVAAPAAAIAPVAPAETAAATAAAPASPAPVTAAIASAPAVAATPVATPPPAKLNLVQRLALNKAAKKINKLVAKAPQFKQRDATASTARLDGNLRYAIIFGVLSLIFFAIGGGLLNLIGTILLIIGLLFLLFWVLDAL